MHVLFVHKEFPGHFGHVARHLARRPDFDCTLVYNSIPARFRAAGVHDPGGGVRLIPYQTRGASRDTHPCSLHLEIATWHSHAVLEALRARPDVRPDLIVGHASYGTALLLADHYRRPLIHYCEYYHNLDRSHLTFRPEYPPREADLQARHAFNAVNLLSLDAAAACYSPTEWQRGLFPEVYQPRIRTLFDGIDRNFWHRREVPRRVGDRTIPPGTRVVTYCSYGLEPTRGFDIFMEVAGRICRARADVLFIIVGADRSYYAPGHPSGQSFRDHILSRGRYDLARFVFTGQILEEPLVEILSLSDLHVYLTVPFVLSWSLFDALSCACTVLASDTAPVRELIAHEENGLLAGFDDIDGLTREALRVLDDPAAFRHLGDAGVARIERKYSIEATIPETIAFFESVASGPPGS